MKNSTQIPIKNATHSQVSLNINFHIMHVYNSSIAYCILCFQGSVQSILDRKTEMDNQAHICEQLGKPGTLI